MSENRASPRRARCSDRQAAIAACLLALTSMGAAGQNSEGQLDLSFSGDGKASFTFLLDGEHAGSRAVAVGVQSGGRVVLAGNAIWFAPGNPGPSDQPQHRRHVARRGGGGLGVPPGRLAVWARYGRFSAAPAGITHSS